LVKNRRNERAIPFYEKAVAQDSARVIYHIRFGVAYFRAGKYSQAREIFANATTRFPNNGTLYYLVGYAARAEGQFDVAQKSFERSLELQPDNAETYANLGFLASERGEATEAERLLRRALELDRDNYPATYDLGRLLIRQRRYDEALGLLKRGAELSKDDPGVHYQLFLVYSRLKQKTDADRELAVFKKLEEVRKAGEGGAMGGVTKELQAVPNTPREPLPTTPRDKP